MPYKDPEKRKAYAHFDKYIKWSKAYEQSEYRKQQHKKRNQSLAAREAKKKWRQSEEGKLYNKEYQKKYSKTKKGKDYLKKYRQTEKYKQAQRLYEKSEQRIKYKQSDDYKKVRQRYWKSEKFKMWRKTPAERLNQLRCHLNRQAAKYNIIELFSMKEWQQMKEATKGICPCCNKDVGLDYITLDHIYAISLAYNDFLRTNIKRVYTIKDIQPLCGSCNSSKRDKYIDLKPKGLYTR
jgi:hypothetical protein